MKNSILVQKFIEQIWNNRAFEMLDSFLHPSFKDYSLLPLLPPDREGTKTWIITTGQSFEHKTTIEDQVTEENQCMVRIRMNLKHIGTWRGIESTGIELQTIGYRHFKIKDERIIEHWALLDGQAIENQLRDASHSCTLVTPRHVELPQQ